MMDELFNSGMITMLSRQVDDLTKELNKYKQNQLSIEQLDYLLEISPRFENMTSKKNEIMCKQIGEKLLKQKEMLENEL